jgi:protein-L-isoaspartate(D-aspartate) O-methyltransferase
MAERRDPFERARIDMVDRQLRGRGISDSHVLEAMATVPREAFVPRVSSELAYADGALPLPSGQSISQPYMVARMTELLEPVPGMRVLEIGTGSGYQAAVLAQIGCQVTSVERVAELARTAEATLEELGYGDLVEVRVGDGSLGAPDGAPWPAIVVTAASPAVPEPLREQLDPAGAQLVIPIGPRDRQDLRVITRHGDEWVERSDGPCVFVPLVGAEGYRLD